MGIANDYQTPNGAILIHDGTPGMKWHHRRYQNYDGSLTALGRIHYGVGPARVGKSFKYKTEDDNLKKKERKDEGKGHTDEVNSYEQRKDLTRFMRSKDKNGHELTIDDMKRINSEDDIRKKYKRNHPDAKKGIDLALDITGKSNNTMNSLKRSALSIADLYDANQNAKNQIDLSKVSNQELQAAITRMDLERKYTQMTTQQHAGRDAVETAFNIGMGALDMANLTLGIMSTIKGLRS